MNALVVPVAGPAYVTDADGLAAKQSLVGGWIEGITVKIGEHFVPGYANEEGLLEDLPLNERITVAYRAAHSGEGYIVGDVILFGETDEDGYDTDVSPDIIKEVEAAGWLSA